jgi:tetratricopeptide (TPR) repeat protein
VTSLLITGLTAMNMHSWAQSGGMAWGHQASVSNGVLTFAPYVSSTGRSGQKMSFVLNSDTKITCGAGCGPGHKPVPVDQIGDFGRVRVQFSERAGSKIAQEIVVYDPVHPDHAVPAVIAHAQEAEAHFRRALGLHQKGDLVDAVAEYRAGIKLNRFYQNAFNNLGNALDELGQPQEAVKAYRAALDLNPLYAAAHYNLALTLEKLGDSATAKQQYLLACPAMPSQYCPQPDPSPSSATKSTIEWGLGPYCPNGTCYSSRHEFERQRELACARSGDCH